jgi:hypothetical protein
MTLSGCLERAPSELEFSKVDNAFRESQLVQGNAPLNYASLKKYILKRNRNHPAGQKTIFMRGDIGKVRYRLHMNAIGSYFVTISQCNNTAPQ